MILFPNITNAFQAKTMILFVLLVGQGQSIPEFQGSAIGVLDLQEYQPRLFLYSQPDKSLRCRKGQGRLNGIVQWVAHQSVKIDWIKKSQLFSIRNAGQGDFMFAANQAFFCYTNIP